MLETLQKLCQLLSKDPLSVEEVASALGSGGVPTGSSAPIRVTPYNQSFLTIEITRKKGSGEPSNVVLTPVPAKTLTIGQLKSAFGDFHDLPRSNYRSPHRVLFRPSAKGQAHSCAVLADFDADDALTDSTQVTSLTMRRDVAAVESASEK
jgi:hypothetical protein